MVFNMIWFGNQNSVPVKWQQLLLTTQWSLYCHIDGFDVCQVTFNKFPIRVSSFELSIHWTFYLNIFLVFCISHFLIVIWNSSVELLYALAAGSVLIYVLCLFDCSMIWLCNSLMADFWCTYVLNNPIYCFLHFCYYFCNPLKIMTHL